MKKEYYLCFIFLYFLCGTALKQDDALPHQGYHNHSLGLQYLMDSLIIEPEELWVLIDKSDYKLSVMAGEKLLKEYPVVFGGNPVDDKLRQGDQRTPEGTFRVRDLYPHKSWSKFIWIDYPTKDSWLKHNQAKKDGQIPQTASIGGEIGIHGVPEGYDYAIDEKMNWTLGCISLKNKDVNELYPQMYKGMVVEIRK